jgi:16S rRNA (guanine527-N7)-methyltransferase
MLSKENDIVKEIAELERGFKILDIAYNKNTLRKFRKYIEILYQYKGKIHLISHQDYRRISKRHFLTSFMAFPYVIDHNHACDIGAGAGFPSIPLKIICPQINFTLFESKKKKAEFLKRLIDELHLSGIKVVGSRAEDYESGNFDLILIKAAGKIKKLIKVIDLFLTPNGRAIFYKSHRIESEMRAAEKELEKRKFEAQVKQLVTPIEKLPFALVILKRV